MATITLACDGVGDRRRHEVVADVFGVWAAHRNERAPHGSQEWAISHTPTGLQIATAATQGAAHAVAAALSAFAPIGVTNGAAAVRLIDAEVARLQDAQHINNEGDD